MKITMIKIIKNDFGFYFFHKNYQQNKLSREKIIHSLIRIKLILILLDIIVMEIINIE